MYLLLTTESNIRTLLLLWTPILANYLIGIIFNNTRPGVYNPFYMNVATSIVIGRTANPNLASQAVTLAMLKAHMSHANSVLLLLSSEFANNPQPAIRAAAKAANCTQVFGCSATGIFTEEDWVLDAPAAAVMVFSGDIAHSAC